MRLAILVAAVATIGVGLALTASSFRRSGPTPPISKPPLEEPDAPKADEIANPHLREARENADAILEGLLAGNFAEHPQLAPVARKVNGYRAHSIKCQQMLTSKRAEFCGVLTGAPEPARFSMTLVEQKDGKWEIGAFSGPEPE
jgi:hypothetical protein